MTAYTAELWRNLPVPREEPEPGPDYVYGTVELPGGRLIGARVRGKKHCHQGTNCDDWYEFAAWGDVTCLAVSDGAGSGKFSRIGARESCRRAVSSLVGRLAENLDPALRWQMGLPLEDQRCMAAWGVLAGMVQGAVLEAAEAAEAAFEARRDREEYAAALGRELRLEDFAGTLLTAVIVPLENGECLTAVCQVGDGAAALVVNTGGVKLLGAADSGAFAGETVFLTSPQVRRLEALQSRTRIARCKADALLLMTDGVADDYFPPETELSRLYRDLEANGILTENAEGMSLGLRLKKWLEGYVERGSFDDRTLVILQNR